MPERNAKVYCDECAHFVVRKNTTHKESFACIIRNKGKDTWRSRAADIEGKPEYKNAQNNCPDYESKPQIG